MALNKQALSEFAYKEVVAFHEAKARRIDGLTLTHVLSTKNPYLFRAKNMNSAADLIVSVLDAFLSSSEEKMFGDLLESVAIEVSRQCDGGAKSSTLGVDLEFTRDGTRHIVSIKSGPNWGNSQQWKRLATNLQTATRIYVQGGNTLVHPALGICYGKRKLGYNGTFWVYSGQAFWHYLSGDPYLYLDLIEPVARNAKKHNDAIQKKRDALANRMLKEFIDDYCSPDHCIDWERLVVFNSGNLTEE